MYICFCIYICSYYWILLVLNMESGNLVVFDSMMCPKETIQHFLDPLNRYVQFAQSKSFLCLKQLFSIKLNSKHRVWKQFVKKNKGASQWRQELNVIMDYPVGWVAYLFFKYSQLFYIGIHKYWTTNLFLLKCARQRQGTDWCGYYVCEFLHLLTPCGRSTMKTQRVCTNRSQVRFLIILTRWIITYRSFFIPKW